MSFKYVFQLKRLVLHKDLCNELSTSTRKDAKNFSMTDSEWTAAKDVVQVLEPFKVATDMFQKEQFVLSDFYRVWLGLKIQLRSFSEDKLAKELSIAMEPREEALISNNALLGCIYLDPRFNFVLSDEHKRLAKAYLEKIYCHMEKMRNHEDGFDSNEGALI